MAEFDDDFDDTSDEGESLPMLPQEDRLWRHPSELARADHIALDPVAVRSRWLERQPTRASAWTAGLVGALLASGLVVLGTHLAGAFTGTSRPTPPALSSADVTTIPNGPAATSTLGNAIGTAISRLGPSLASVKVSIDGVSTDELGLVVNAAGYVEVPYASARDASSILVTLSDGVVYVGQVAGTSPTAGIALVHINGTTNLHAARIVQQALRSGDLTVAVTSPAGSTAVASLSHPPHARSVGGVPISGALDADLPGSTEIGAVLIDGRGRIDGLAVGVVRNRFVVASGATLGAAVRSMLDGQVVSERSLGLECESVTGVEPGAQVLSVTQGSAAADAGIEAGDVIEGVDGSTVTTKGSFDVALHGTSPTAPIVLTVSTPTGLASIVIPASVAKR